MIGSDDYLINADAFCTALWKFDEGNKMVIFELFYVKKNKIKDIDLPKNLIKVHLIFDTSFFNFYV